MQSNWSDAEAEALVAHYAERNVGRDLALRVYTSRLLGRQPKLVLHGGGNTSVKTTARDVFGDEVEVLHVKGSGWDMADIEPEGLPAVRIAPLMRLRSLAALRDEDMVNALRLSLIDSTAPNPSVETLLHAFLPHKFVDHTHAIAVLSLSDQPEGEAICREVFGARVGIVPYIMPGFCLAKAAAVAYEVNPEVEGLVLLKHGIFTFGDDAREAYERMLDLVSLAEARLAAGRARGFAAATLPPELAPVAEVAPILRGALATDRGGGAYGRVILDHRASPQILDYVGGKKLARYSQQGVATPDHVIRTKGKPLMTPAPAADGLEAYAEAVRAAVAGYTADYHAYFAHHNARQTTPKTELDPLPRVVLVPGLGLFGAGKSAREAAVAADIAESTVETVTGAEAIGSFRPVEEADLFDIEYWSLEQAKLGRAAEKPLARQVALVTGAAGTIGAAIAHALAAEGAEPVLLDRDGASVVAAAKRMGGLGIICDVTDPAAVETAFERACAHYGGVDIVVSNAGAAWQGRIGEVADDVLRRSFELNFFAHETVTRCAVRVMRAQGTGGAILYNISKQAINPGPEFGPYGLPKASALALMRQVAVDYGRDGIRANAVNADRIRSGLLTEVIVAARAKARGLSEEDYMSGNLLGREVTAADVAHAFVHLALALKTTGAIITVDGGNGAAMLR